MVLGRCKKFEGNLCWSNYAGNEKFEVNNGNGMRWSADLARRECAHVFSGVLSRNIGIYEYIDAYYIKEAYLSTYSPVTQPMLSPELWPELGRHPVDPPIKKGG